MVLRDVLRQVIVKANIEDKVNIEDRMMAGEEYRRLMIASNNVIREIASSYLPLLRTERVEVRDSKLSMRDLERQPIKIVSLKSGDRSVRFTMYPTYMYAQSGTYDLTYSYLPYEVSIDDTIEIDMRVSEDLLSNAIASEYYLMIGNIERGDMYDKKFRENMKNICVTKREIKVKGRAFV